MSTPVKPGCSPILEEALHRRNMLCRAESGGRAAVVQLVVAGLCLYDANNMFLLGLLTSQPARMVASLLYLVEMSLFAVLVTSFFSSLWSLLAPLHSHTPLSLTSRQFQLLRLHPSSPGFTKSPESSKAQSSNPGPSPLPGHLTLSPAPSITPVNMSSTSWLSQSPTSPTSPLSPVSPPSTNLRSGQYPNSPSSPLTNSSQLAAYLANYSQWEASQSLAEQDTSSQTSQAGPSGLWAGYNNSRQLDFSSSCSGQQVYQLSSPLPPTNNANATDSDKTLDKTQSKVLSHRLGIDPRELVSWNENLRVWLTQTILKPLVSEIDRVNSALPRLGISDVSVGSVPVERLRKVSALPQVNSSLSSLAALLPYLEVSSDQTYLLDRLRALSATGAMSSYRWSAGGQGWTDRLPSDSEIVMHCVTTYMDTRLLLVSTIHSGDNLTSFSGRHFVKFGDKLRQMRDDKNTLAIIQDTKSPVHYVVQVGDKQLDVGVGRNNMIHSLLLFLHTVKVERSGLLGRVNFGLSGLNILWVLD